MGTVVNKNQFELLAPGGDIESIKAAIVAGADAIYCGLDNFNARNRATNLTFENLNGIIKLAHQYDCKIFLTLNIIILESEIPALIRLLNKLVNTKVDGVIVQDLGLFYILKEHFPTLDVHASTQTNTHNEGQIQFLHQLTASRVNLSRELNIHEIKHLAQFGRQHNVLMEVFVHGSYCIGFSGLCYISSVRNGNSGNRGRCSQPCRDQYQTTDAGKDYPLNMKDNSAYLDMAALADAGVYSLKVEGRIKKSHYVHTVVDSWRKQIDNYCQSGEVLTDTTGLYTVFNRDFSNAYLQGDINKSMFIDNPRDHSANHFSKIYSCTSTEQVKQVKRKLYDDKTEIINTVDAQTKDLDISINSLSVSVAGSEGELLSVTISTPNETCTITSSSPLIKAGKHSLDEATVTKWANSFANADHYVASVELTKLDDGLFIPYKEQTAIKEQVAFILNGSRPTVSPVELPKLAVQQRDSKATPSLNVLISSQADIALAQDDQVNVYYQLPEAMHSNLAKMVSLFNSNSALIPWFPAILIGDNYQAAVEFMKSIKPVRIVTNNNGVGFAASQLGIKWIAGPQMNVTNSYSLKCLKEEFNCAGSFISNEIKQQQMKQIVKPDGFELFYSIYHPIMLLTSRQCLFHQTVGCKKKRFDDKCLRKCDKSASILSMKESSFVVDKQRGDHNSLYSPENYLNLDAIKDNAHLFDGYMVDLRDIKTLTQTALDKPALVNAFRSQLNGDVETTALYEEVSPTTMAQYRKGL
ncbi:peptidase U32 family protein [Photobacterium lutimaris]|uniref:Collagenase-like protease n=1 Tax=Photobacterium lutimaris TaxID=388278 RepID=A0A2T3J573_9GAMM|nr:collagenase-like protease [Photobacterium lutimaris]TDR74677.1 putative protease [Photobacterium lutimaris]